jgi:hypothetical protein
MRKAIILSALFAYASSKSDPLADFFKQLDVKVQQTNYGFCQKLHKDQSLASPPLPENEVISFERCMQDANQATTKLIQEFRPIALEEIEKASSNAERKYYEFHPATKIWTFHNQPVASSSFNGDKENAQILTGVLDFRFKQLAAHLGTEKTLQKRAFPNPLKWIKFRPTSTSAFTRFPRFTSLRSVVLSGVYHSITLFSFIAVIYLLVQELKIGRRLDTTVWRLPNDDVAFEEELESASSTESLSNSASDVVTTEESESSISNSTSDVVTTEESASSTESLSNSTSDVVTTEESASSTESFKPEPVIVDEFNNITYYLDPETGFYYFIDPNTNQAVWYLGS